MSSPSITVANLDIGPCIVTWNAIDIGATLGNVTVKFKYEKADMKADQTGTAILDQAISGMKVTIETEFAQVRDKTILATLFPDATFQGSAPHTYLTFKDKTATRQLPNAAALLLHPIVEAAAAHDMEWYFYKAVPTEDSQYVFSPTDQGKMKIIWEVYMDLSVTPGQIFRMGDHTL